jgi:ABC-type dipeptide/oligopeptide/nickel transport system ATPase component
VLFISNDVPVVEFMCDEIGGMYPGEIVGAGPCRQTYEAPRHSYTGAFWTRRRGLDRAARPIDDIPRLVAVAAGCALPTCCPFAQTGCAAMPADFARLAACGARVGQPVQWGR